MSPSPITISPPPHKNCHIRLFKLTSRNPVNHFDEIIFRRFEIVAVQHEENDG